MKKTYQIAWNVKVIISACIDLELFALKSLRTYSNESLTLSYSDRFLESKMVAGCNLKIVPGRHLFLSPECSTS